VNDVTTKGLIEQLTAKRWTDRLIATELGVQVATVWRWRTGNARVKRESKLVLTALQALLDRP